MSLWFTKLELVIGVSYKLAKTNFKKNRISLLQEDGISVRLFVCIVFLHIFIECRDVVTM